jgi:hypothetical protein
MLVLDADDSTSIAVKTYKTSWVIF